MIRFQVITPWQKIVEDGELFCAPSIENDYEILSYSDVTGQQLVSTAPNMLVAECIADESIFSQIEADSNYLVLWSEQA